MQFELITELNEWNTSENAIFLSTSLSGPAQAVLTNLDEDSQRDYYVLKGALFLIFGTGGKMQLSPRSAYCGD